MLTLDVDAGREATHHVDGRWGLESTVGFFEGFGFVGGCDSHWRGEWIATAFAVPRGE